MTQSNPLPPDHISLVVEVVQLRTTADGGIRLTLDFGEGESNAAAWLIDAKNQGIALQAAFVKMTPEVVGFPEDDEATEATAAVVEDDLPSADDIIDEIERKGNK